MALGTIISLGYFTYLFIGESYLFYLAENVVIGGSIVISVASLYKSLISSFVNPVGGGKISLIIPFIIGLLTFARLTKHRWLARYPVAVMSGLGIGVAFGLTIRSQVLNVVVTTVTDVVDAKPDLGSAIFMFVGVIAVLTYFIYSVRLSNIFHSPTGSMRYIVIFGRYCLMASFGYLAAYITTLSFGNVSNYVVVVWFRFIDALRVFFVG